MVAISSLILNSDLLFEPPADVTPEDVFMREWAKSLVDEVLAMVKRWCADQGRSEWWQVFSAVHFPEPGKVPVGQQVLAEQLGLSRDQVRYGLSQTNRRFSDLLQTEVAGQVDSAADVGAEIDEIMHLLEV